MPRLRLIQPLVLGCVVLCHSVAPAKPAFNTSEIEGQGPEITFCDLVGDGLQDAVLVDNTNLSIFFQDAKQGFSRRPQQQLHLDDQPSVLWPARLGRNAASLLRMTSDGVTELYFTNRSDPPTQRQIIAQRTILPDKTGGEPMSCFPMSADTGMAWPLLLVPVAGGLQVWQHRDTWRQAQFIEHAADEHLRPAGDNPGYDRLFGLSLCVADVNGDGRDDLMVERGIGGGKETFTLYLQNTNGLFTMEPAMTYTNTPGWWTVPSWFDLNRDGRVDLIKSMGSDEPSFVPGLQSGKVLVAMYVADEQGRIPATPQQVFRKSDWAAILPMVDVDGDGYMDLVLGYIPIDSRDQFRNMITAGEIKLDLKFHFSRPGAAFSQEPDYQRSLSIYFDHDLIWTSTHRIYYEKFVSLNGDFNGDGKKDLLARDSKDEISVYFFNSRETGFSSRADLKFHFPELMDWWQVKDLNGDGVSDLVVKLKNEDVFRIFISQGK